MLQFFKYVFATIIGLFLFTLVGILILVGMAASAGSEKPQTIDSNSILKLDFNYDIPEKSINNPFAAFDFNTFKPKKATGLYEIVQSLRKAAKDDKIKGAYLEMGVNTNGMATLEVIRQELKEFKKSGKFIYAFGNMANQKSYYLAAVADKIYLNPSGGLEVTGFGREIMYYKGAFEKLGIQIQDFHCGAFKSAIEPYLRDKMTDQNREQMMNIYKDVYSGFLKNVSEDRKIDESQLNDVVNNLKSFLPEDAKDNKLVDEIAYYDEVLNAIKTKLGVKETKDIKMVEIGKYAATLEKDVDGNNKIAIIVADGEIVDGEGKDGQIGGDAFAKTIRKAREDENVKAIVLRVNSPGGSALASDIMWRELILAKKAKPLVVSMGDLAASGGYFISAPADKIFAQPNTITGSIGVFGLVPNIKKMLNEKLGVTTDQVEVTKHGAFNMVTNPFDDEEKAVIQRNIEKTYREFKQRVAEGRNKDTAYIETIAQGHVWTGNQGLQNGLVDEIGNLDDALKFAAKKANITSYRVKLYPTEKSLSEQLAEGFGEAKTNFIKEELGSQYEVYNTLKTIQSSTGIQMRMVYNLGIE